MCLQRCLSGADVVESCQVPKHDLLQRAHRGPALTLHDWWNIATCLALKKNTQKKRAGPLPQGHSPSSNFLIELVTRWRGEARKNCLVTCRHLTVKDETENTGLMLQVCICPLGSWIPNAFFSGVGVGEGHVVSVCSGPASTAQLLSYGMHVTSLACWLLSSPMFGTISISWLRKRERMQQAELQWWLTVGFLRASNPLSTTFKSEVWLWGGSHYITALATYWSFQWRSVLYHLSSEGQTLGSWQKPLFNFFTTTPSLPLWFHANRVDSHAYPSSDTAVLLFPL